MTDEVFIEDNINGTRISMYSIINKLSREIIGANLKKEFTYDNAYLCVGNSRAKINKLILVYDVTESKDTLRICGSVKSFAQNQLQSPAK